MVAVVVGAADPYRSVAQLLDKGFAIPADAQEAFDHLPPVVLGDAREPETGAAPAARPVSTPTAPASTVTRQGAAVPTELVLLVGGSAPAVAILMRRRRRSATGFAWPE